MNTYYVHYNRYDEYVWQAQMAVIMAVQEAEDLSMLQEFLP